MENFASVENYKDGENSNSMGASANTDMDVKSFREHLSKAIRDPEFDPDSFIDSLLES